jgi:hypothetical protein
VRRARAFAVCRRVRTISSSSRSRRPNCWLVSRRCCAAPARKSFPACSRSAILELDRETHRVKRRGRDIKLGPTEFRLLEYLMSSPGRVYSRAQLLDGVWGHDVYVDERTVDVHVGRLRKAVNLSGKMRDHDSHRSRRRLLARRLTRDISAHLGREFKRKSPGWSRALSSSKPEILAKLRASAGALALA